MKTIRLLATVILFVSVFTLAAAAQERRSITLVESAHLTFEPQDAFFIVERPTLGNVRVKAMQAESQDLSPETAGKGWVFGARVLAEVSSRPMTYGLVVVGPQLEIYFSNLKKIDGSEQHELSRSVDEIRDEVLQRKSVLASYNVQVQAQGDALRRLRDDAELIGNYGRVLEVNDELDQTKTDIRNADKDLANIDRLVKQVSSKAGVAPKNAVSREQQLTEQLRELAEVARNAEVAEGSRKLGAQTDLQQKLALVEQTRYEDYDALVKELESLKAERQQLEKQRPAR